MHMSISVNDGDRFITPTCTFFLNCQSECLFKVNRVKKVQYNLHLNVHLHVWQPFKKYSLYTGLTPGGPMQLEVIMM